MNTRKIKSHFFSQIFTILTSLFMVSVGASEDFLTSMMNKPKELEMGEKNKNPSVKYYSKLKKALESLYKTRQKQGLLYFLMLFFRTI